MADIVEQLKELAIWESGVGGTMPTPLACMAREAADEIERLRAEVDKVHAEWSRMATAFTRLDKVVSAVPWDSIREEIAAARPTGV